MQTYLDALRHVLENGTIRDDRTGTGTRSVFGYQMRFNLSKGFPLVTTKRVHTKSVFAELVWMLQGRTDVAWLNDRGVTIWDEWTLEDGTIGTGYGYQWRHWDARTPGVYTNQIYGALHTIVNAPNSRRNIVSAWNVDELHHMALPPCHAFFQFYVADGRLSCHLYQRSGDIFLGVPFNIAFYSAMTILFARLTGLEPGEFVHSFGDLHLYNNHVDQATEQLSREPRPLPTLDIRLPQVKPDEDDDDIDVMLKIIDSLDWDDFIITGYDPHPRIKAPVAV